jgi:hypothetical protein
MSRQIVRTAAVFAAAAALAGAPTASARPAVEGPQLNYAQLKAIHGHVPPEPLGYYTARPVQTLPGGRPVHLTAPAGSTSPVPWIAGGVAALLFAAFGIVRFTGVRPQRRRQPAA